MANYRVSIEGGQYLGEIPREELDHVGDHVARNTRDSTGRYGLRDREVEASSHQEAAEMVGREVAAEPNTRIDKLHVNEVGSDETETFTFDGERATPVEE